LILISFHHLYKAVQIFYKNFQILHLLDFLAYITIVGIWLFNLAVLYCAILLYYLSDFGHIFE